MQKWRSWEAASEAEWGLAVEREMVIRPLAEQERLSTAAIQDAIGRLGLSRSVLYDLVRRYRRRPQTSSLLPWKRGRGLSVHVLAQEREELLQVCIREFYLTPSGLPSPPSDGRSGGVLRKGNFPRPTTAPYNGALRGSIWAGHSKTGRSETGARKVRAGRRLQFGSGPPDGPRPD